MNLHKPLTDFNVILWFSIRFFASVSEYCARYAPTTALNVLLGFLTSTAVNRYLSVHRDLPGTAKALTYLVSSLKDDTPNVSVSLRFR